MMMYNLIGKTHDGVEEIFRLNTGRQASPIERVMLKTGAVQNLLLIGACFSHARYASVKAEAINKSTEGKYKVD